MFSQKLPGGDDLAEKVIYAGIDLMIRGYPFSLIQG
jgi:hypothetical protein